MFNSLSEMINHFKNNPKIEGILEYGSKHYLETENTSGDYDLTIVTTEKIFFSLTGVHFHVQNIPVDCMIKSLSDFNTDKPTNKFDYVHLNANILFDRFGRIGEMLKTINDKWIIKEDLTEREISKYRFRFSHFIDKLKHRICKAEYYMFCCHTMTIAISQSLECYCRLNNLPLGKPLLYFTHMQQNNKQLYILFKKYYNARLIMNKFKILKSIFEILLSDIGGLWRTNEILYHGNTDNVPENEKEMIREILNNEENEYHEIL